MLTFKVRAIKLWHEARLLQNSDPKAMTKSALHLIQAITFNTMFFSHKLKDRLQPLTDLKVESKSKEALRNRQAIRKTPLLRIKAA